MQVKYKNCIKPVLTIKEALKDPENRIKQHSAFGPSNVFDAGNLEGKIYIFFLIDQKLRNGKSLRELIQTAKHNLPALSG